MRFNTIGLRKVIIVFSILFNGVGVSGLSRTSVARGLGREIVGFIAFVVVCFVEAQRGCGITLLRALWSTVATATSVVTVAA